MTNLLKEKENNPAIRVGLGVIKAIGINATNNLVKERNKNGNFIDIYDLSERLGSKIINKKSIEALSKSGALDTISDNRKKIFNSSNIISKYASLKEEEKNSSQMTFFSSDNIINDRPNLSEIEDWSKLDKLYKEFEVFGFFINNHPIDSNLENLKVRNVIFFKDIEDSNFSNNSIINLSGVVISVNHRFGSKGRYTNLVLSDPSNTYEISIFNESLITKSRDIIQTGHTLVITCLFKVDNGGFRLITKEISTIDEFIKNNKPSNTQTSILNDNSNIEGKFTESNSFKLLPKVTLKINNSLSLHKIKKYLDKNASNNQNHVFTEVYFLITEKNNIIKIKLNKKYSLTKDDANHLQHICII